MDRDRTPESTDPQADESEALKKGEQARRELDENPPPGTDPLHEGP